MNDRKPRIVGYRQALGKSLLLRMSNRWTLVGTKIVSDLAQWSDSGGAFFDGNIGLGY